MLIVSEAPAATAMVAVPTVNSVASEAIVPARADPPLLVKTTVFEPELDVFTVPKSIELSLKVATGLVSTQTGGPVKSSRYTHQP